MMNQEHKVERGKQIAEDQLTQILEISEICLVRLLVTDTNF